MVRTFAPVLAMCLVPAIALAQGRGSIQGTVVTSGDRPLSGVTVLLQRGEESVSAAITDDQGRFFMAGIPAGTYSLSFTLGPRVSSENGIEVDADSTAVIRKSVDWDAGFVETITVSTASRRAERIVDAPAAVTTVSREMIALEAAPGQVPKLLEFTPGVQVTQSGVFDFNLNTRGFNRTLTRRVQTLVDGRDISIPFLAGQEWIFSSFLADDLASVELLRGPSAALHGPNSFNGVLNMTTTRPRDTQGGLARVTVGELDTAKGEFRWAGALGNGWYMKALGGHYESDDFTQSRNETVEYPGIAPEAIPLPTTRLKSTQAGVRFDHYATEAEVMTVEGGLARGDGVAFLTPAGRSFVEKSNRQWVRFNWSTPRWNLLSYLNRRDAPDGVGLGVANSFFTNELTYRAELQRVWDVPRRGRLVTGASAGAQRIDSADRAGRQTVLDDTVHSTHGALFGQFDWSLSSKLNAVLALRWDESDLHDAQLSPKAAVVYSLAPDHKMRLSYNRAFQVGNFVEYFIRFPAATLDLSALEALFEPVLGGRSLGLDAVAITVEGNQNLKVEAIKGFEIGYTGILAHRASLNVNYYRNRMSDFITDALPGVNPHIPSYRAPADLPPGAAPVIESALNAALPGLTNDAAGRPKLVLSYGNTGEVDSQGVEIAVTYGVTPRWLVDGSYSWFDFHVRGQTTVEQVAPNAPRHGAAASVRYHGTRANGALSYRWSDAFAWISGVWVGRVPAYTVVDLDASYDISPHWRLGANIANLLDDSHYEVFGGDLLRRRALAHLAFRF